MCIIVIRIYMNVDKFLINDLYKFHSEYYEKFLQIESYQMQNIGLLKTLSFCEHGKICGMLLLLSSVPLDLFIARLEEHLI